jgi:hypothetical protein
MRTNDDMGNPPPFAAERLRCPGLAARVDDLERALRDVRAYLDDLGNYPEPGEAIKAIDRALGAHGAP